VQGLPATRRLMEAAAKGPLQPLVLADTTDSIPRRIRPTHWKKGALIGGLAGGAALAVLVETVCSLGDCGGSATVNALLGGAVLGGIVGALIGGQFPKEEEEAADPERRSKLISPAAR
jgi:hypothetical protein